MKTLLAFLCLSFLPLAAQSKVGSSRKSLLDSDPRVVYLTDLPDKQIELMIIKEAPVFSDVDGKFWSGKLIVSLFIFHK